MNTFVIYSRHDHSRNWNHAPDGTWYIDWYDKKARANLIDETGPLHVGLFPTVFIWTDAWTEHATHSAETWDHDKQWTAIHKPNSWDDVDVAVADYADRTLRGWTATGDIPPVGPLTWSEPPDVEDGQFVMHDGWDDDGDGGWVRRWRVEEDVDADGDGSDDGDG